MIKGSTQEEDITIINIYAPNIGASQYVRQMLTSMKGEINNNTIIVGDFNTPLTPMDRSTKQKISKETQKQTQNNKVNGNGTYLSVITLNVNELNAPTRKDWLNGYKNKTPIYPVYKRPTSK